MGVIKSTLLASIIATAAMITAPPLVAGQSSCGYNQAVLSNGTCFPCAVLQYPNGTSCANYASLGQKMAGDFAATHNAGDTAWMLAGTALVMVMTPALALFYGGLSTEGNVMNTMMLSVMCVAIITVEWALFGYSLAFGPGNAFIGSFEWAAMNEISTYPSAVYALTSPHKIFVAFQCMFAQITPALISGAIIGRMTFVSFCVFIMIWHAVVYCPLAHFVWANTLDANGAIVPAGFWAQLGAIDFAGGTVIHISSGFAALAASLVVGPRIIKKEAHADVTKLLTGAALLWFGWFGFNAGSANVADPIASNAFLTTHVATASSVIVYVTCEYVHKRKITFVGACCAMVIGLVAITPACGYVSIMSSIGVGGIAALTCYLGNQFKMRYASAYLDDTLDVFMCHGFSGFMGAILTGIFADSSVNTYPGAVSGNGYRVVVQLGAAVTSAAYSFTCSCVILLIMKYTIGIRVSEEEEIEGLDRAHESNADLRDNSCAPTDEDEPFAIVFTDIEKSTKLWAKDSHGMTRAIETHHKIIREIIKRHGMYEVKTVGDSFMVASSNLPNAIRFAMDLQSEFYNADWSAMPFIDDVYNRVGEKANDSNSMAGGGSARSSVPTQRSYIASARASARGIPIKGSATMPFKGLRVRVGVHYGYGSVQFDTVVKGYDYYGMVVNIAARIEDLGHGGQVLISEEAWIEAKRQDPSVIEGTMALSIIGAQRLRGVTDPVAVIQVLPIALAARRFPPLRNERDAKPDRSQRGREAQQHQPVGSSRHHTHGAGSSSFYARNGLGPVVTSSRCDDDDMLSRGEIGDSSVLLPVTSGTPPSSFEMADIHRFADHRQQELGGSSHIVTTAVHAPGVPLSSVDYN